MRLVPKANETDERCRKDGTDHLQEKERRDRAATFVPEHAEDGHGDHADNVLFTKWSSY